MLMGNEVALMSTMRARILVVLSVVILVRVVVADRFVDVDLIVVSLSI